MTAPLTLPTSTTVKPFFIWAGGKTRLLKHYAPIFPQRSFTTYVEPFFGGGAVFAWLSEAERFQHGVINDINPELMGLFRAVRDKEDTFLKEVDELLDIYLPLPTIAERKAFYYELRSNYWEDPTTSKLFVLMRLGFNGIWQTCKESKGLFGTPAGLLNHRSKEQVYRHEVLDAWSAMLSTTSIYSGDYAALSFDPDNTLIYLDPPYRDSFTTYGTGFDDAEQRRLIAWLKTQHQGGATVLLANRCVEGDDFFEDLLPEAEFHYFDVTYTAGRRKKVENGFEAKKAREFLAILKHDS